eukprot:m.150125 g.150125  ORF g.150125 m.150125 type:complete len:1115 (+) comp14222_c0_seq1:189-3533(+)
MAMSMWARGAARSWRTLAGAAPVRVLSTGGVKPLFAQENTTPAKPSLIEESMANEARRQRDSLVLIPSESICFPECESVVASSFGNIYAEGQPDLRLNRDSPAISRDHDYFHAWHRRLSDGRFYRGCSEGDRVELLAKSYVAEAFAMLPGSPPASDIHVTVQALSGSPANLAVYSALMEFGDSMLTLNLSHGGHLSHGSPFNISGKYYNTTQYGVDPNTRMLDYDAIQTLAEKCQPKVIVGGASAYPWDWDWARLRQIADSVGAKLHADVCHYAGLIVAGQLNNPLEFADTIVFTTHKTLMGPRGAIIITPHRDIAKAIDNAVFPGFQGGPHMNNIAGIGRLFETIVHHRDDFCRLQRAVKENQQVFADALAAEGFTLEYGGSNTHMALIDLKDFDVESGNVLDGETASRLLENVGIVVNKNTLPGDETAADSSGIRVGTPWLTQRGITPDQLRELASIIATLLKSARGFQVWAPSGDEKCRARVPFAVLQEAKQRVAAITRALPYPTLPSDLADDSQFDPLRNAVVVNGMKGLLVRGEKTKLGLDQTVTCNVHDLKPNETAQGFVLAPSGEVLSPVAIQNLGTRANLSAGVRYEENFAVFVPEEKAQLVHDWLQAVSDGYVSLKEGSVDPYCKIDGPFAITGLPETELSEEAKQGLVGPLPGALSDASDSMVNYFKPFFVGQQMVSSSATASATALPEFVYDAPEAEIKKTVLNEWHHANGGQMVNFGGWDMPVKYNNIAEEHKAVRTQAGLFDVSHMSCVGVEGPNALAFLELVMANTAARLVDNEAQYTYMLKTDGTALDDAYAYRLGPEQFMIVFNAANFERDWAWINAVNNGEVCIDAIAPYKRLQNPAKLTALRNAGTDSLLDIALQGPESMRVLENLLPKESVAELRRGRLNDIHHVSVGGVDIMAARTGYTGEEVGFELFAHPDQTETLWKMLLENPAVTACGLGARDSTRIEAGFPLFGQELEGPEQLSLTESDYGYVSRFHRPFYIGRDAYIERTHPRNKRLLRLKGAGRKSARPGHAILDAEGRPVGAVTSFAFNSDDFDYCAIAAVDAQFVAKPGETLRIARMQPGKVPAGGVSDSKTVEVEVLTRFPTPEEKAQWKVKYGQ